MNRYSGCWIHRDSLRTVMKAIAARERNGFIDVLARVIVLLAIRRKA